MPFLPEGRQNLLIIQSNTATHAPFCLSRSVFHSASRPCRRTLQRASHTTVGIYSSRVAAVAQVLLPRKGTWSITPMRRRFLPSSLLCYYIHKEFHRKFCHPSPPEKRRVARSCGHRPIFMGWFRWRPPLSRRGQLIHCRFGLLDCSLDVRRRCPFKSGIICNAASFSRSPLGTTWHRTEVYATKVSIMSGRPQ